MSGPIFCELAGLARFIYGAVGTTVGAGQKLACMVFGRYCMARESRVGASSDVRVLHHDARRRRVPRGAVSASMILPHGRASPVPGIADNMIYRFRNGPRGRAYTPAELRRLYVYAEECVRNDLLLVFVVLLEAL